MAVAPITEQEVRQLIGAESESIAPTAAIRIADLLVAQQLVDPVKTQDEALLREINLYLAAHFYHLSIREGPLASESIGDATERYHNIYSAGLGSTRFGQTVLMLDNTGTFLSWSRNALAENAPLKAVFQVIPERPRTKYDLEQ